MGLELQFFTEGNEGGLRLQIKIEIQKDPICPQVFTPVGRKRGPH